MKKMIGLIPMSAKPYTAGHDGLIRLAAKECDEVNVFISLSDRDIIKGKNMQQAWETLIKDTLPDNVDLFFGGIPVRNVYEYISNDYTQTDNKYSIYSDPTDLKNNFGKIKKYIPDIDDERLIFRPVDRTETIDISGTKMRDFMKKDDFISFAHYTPSKINAKKYWELLKKLN